MRFREIKCSFSGQRVEIFDTLSFEVFCGAALIICQKNRQEMRGQSPAYLPGQTHTLR